MFDHPAERGSVAVTNVRTRAAISSEHPQTELSAFTRKTVMTALYDTATDHNGADIETINRLRKAQGLTTAVQAGVQRRGRGRPTKFTPERMQQVINLVERGKSREEIAETIGVTTGTLQVTCSKLGISLRRPRFDTGTGLLRLRRPGQGVASPDQPGSQPKRISAEAAAGSRPGPEATPRQSAESAPEESKRLALATFAIQIQYKGEQRLTELPLCQEMIRQLAMEAELRGMRIAELVSELILGVAEKDLFRLVLATRPEQRDGIRASTQSKACA